MCSIVGAYGPNYSKQLHSCYAINRIRFFVHIILHLWLKPDNHHARFALFIMAISDGLKCPCMQWHTGDDQIVVQDYKKRLQRWCVIKNIDKEQQHNYIIFQAGEVGEERSKTWNISVEVLKDPVNVWTKFEQSVGLAEISESIVYTWQSISKMKVRPLINFIHVAEFQN